MIIEKTHCKLCKKEKVLELSHIIPAFVYKWLKNTSATGFFRDYESPNVRRQDGQKIKLLCGECEDLLNIYETEFSKRIFYPYVSEELDQFGVAQSKIPYFDYSDWLLRFIISIQWRVASTDKLSAKDYSNNLFELKSIQVEYWRQFLLKERDNTGVNETYMLFLQNLAGAFGSWPENLSPKINNYVLRSIDSTSASSATKIAMYFKLGPMAFFTTIKPNSMKNVSDIRVKMRGRIKTAQHLDNEDINNFVLITRPNEIAPMYNISDKQQSKINETLLKNPDRVVNSLSIGATEGDRILKERKINN
jgi:hypothetical protein